jgi:hypothetical protein
VELRISDEDVRELVARARALGLLDAGATVNLREGTVTGTIRYQYVLAANSQKDVGYDGPSLPLFVNGLYVELNAGSVQAITVDLY